MKKILYFDFFGAATEFYRSSGVFPYLKSDDFILTKSTETNITWSTISGYDVIFLERPSSDTSLAIMKLAKDQGIKTIIDFDDNCLSLDTYNPMYETYVHQKANVMECLVLADELWVSTEAIKSAFKLYNRNIYVIPNAHHDYLFPVKDKRPFTYNKKAMWRGGHSHIADMYALDVPEKIIEMVNGNPDWTFSFIGQRFEFLELRCGDNYIAKGGASTVQFYKMMHDENPCVFFYPLADTVFNKSKSNIAFLESTYAGAAFFGNKYLPEFNIISIIQFDTNMVAHDSESMKIANQLSWEYICDNLLLSNINKLRKERLLAI